MIIVAISVDEWGDPSDQIIVSENALIPVRMSGVAVLLPASDVVEGMHLQGVDDDFIQVRRVETFDDSDVGDEADYETA